MPKWEETNPSAVLQFSQEFVSLVLKVHMTKTKDDDLYWQAKINAHIIRTGYEWK